MITQLNRWRIAFALVAIGFVILSYQYFKQTLVVFDQEVTLGMIREHAERREKALAIVHMSLLEVLRTTGHLNRDDILPFFRKRTPNAQIVLSKTDIKMDYVTLWFAPDGSLERIEVTGGRYW